MLVFIVGMPRSGTIWCEQSLAAHRDVHGAGERLALGQLFAELHALAPEAGRVVDKMPGNALHLGLVGLMLPGAKVIYSRCNSRDKGLSIFTFRFHGHRGSS